MPSAGEAFAQAFNPAGVINTVLQGQAQTRLQEKLDWQEQIKAQEQARNERLDKVRGLSEALKGANEFQKQSLLKEIFRITGVNLPDNFFPHADELGQLAKDMTYYPPNSPEALEGLSKVTQLLPAESSKVFLEHINKARANAGLQALGRNAGMPMDSTQATAVAENPQLQQEFAKTAFQTPVARATAAKLQEQATRIEQLNAVNIDTIQVFAPVEGDAEATLATAEKYRKVMGQANALPKNSPLRRGVESRVPEDGSRASLNDYRTQLKAQADRSSQSLVTLSNELRETKLGYQTLKEKEGKDSVKLRATELRLEALQKAVDVKEAEGAFLNNPNLASLQRYQQATQALTGFHERLSKQNQGFQRDLLSLRQQQQAFAQQKELNKELYEHQVAGAQVEVARLGGDTTTPDYLNKVADIAERHGVKVSDIAPAGKNVNKAGVEVVIPNASERKDLAEGEAAVQRLTNIEAAYKPDYVGFFDKPIGALRQMTNTISGPEAAFRAEVEQYGMEQRHRIFGSALSANEKQSALDAIPNLGMSDKQFKAAVAKSREWEQLMLQKRRGELSKANTQKQGKSLSSRYEELIKSGLSREDAYATMKEEGY